MTRKPPRSIAGHGGYTAAHQLAPALEQVGGVFHELAPFVDHFLAAVVDVFACFADCVLTLLGLVGNEPTGFLAALRSQQDGRGHTYYRTGNKPPNVIR